MARTNRRLRNALRREARDILQGGPPTVELLRPVGPEVPSDELVYEVVDLCLQVGEALLATGEAAADTAATMTRLAAAFGLTTVEVDITFTSITMCCRRGSAVAPVTSMRVVRYRATFGDSLQELPYTCHVPDEHQVILDRFVVWKACTERLMLELQAPDRSIHLVHDMQSAADSAQNSYQRALDRAKKARAPSRVSEQWKTDRYDRIY